MTTNEARKIVRSFDESNVLSEEEIFMYTEALGFLIDKEKNPRDMLRLGGWYYDQRQFDLALKYYEMAAAFDYDPAYECLGYIWYYGRTGERDFKKAFEYFSRLMDKGDLVAAYKVADMYRNGYYVDQDYDKYVEIIESLYPRAKDLRYTNQPLPEIFSRLARIRVKQGREKEAVNLYLRAKDFQAQRLIYSTFFGDLNIMKWIIEDLYGLIEFDPDDFSLFDLYYLLKEPHKVSFEYEGGEYVVESVQEEKDCSISFGGKWYLDPDAFFKNAAIDDRKLSTLNQELYLFTLVK